MAVAPDFPDTTWTCLDLVARGVTSTIFEEHQGAHPVGAAAALTTQTNTFGLLGGYLYDAIERFRAGYEAGARAVTPDVTILAPTCH